MGLWASFVVEQYTDEVAVGLTVRLTTLHSIELHLGSDGHYRLEVEHGLTIRYVGASASHVGVVDRVGVEQLDGGHYAAEVGVGVADVRAVGGEAGQPVVLVVVHL